MLRFGPESPTRTKIKTNTKSKKKTTASQITTKETTIKAKSKVYSKGLKHSTTSIRSSSSMKFPTPISEEDDYMDEFDEDGEEEEMQFLKQSQIGHLLRQQAIDAANNAKNGVGNITTAGSSHNNMNNNVLNGNGEKKGNPIQNMGRKFNPCLIDQKTLAGLEMNNAHQLGGLNFNSASVADAKRGNDMNSIMDLPGFNVNGATNVVNASGLGANPNAVGGYQVHHQANNGLQQMPKGTLE